MRTTVVAVVMVMSCVMMVHADVKPQKDFNLQRFVGRWYRVGLAYDSQGFVPFRDKLKASMGLVTALPNGNVNLTMWDATPLGCLMKVYQYEKTNVAGQFTYFSTRHNMVKDITVVDTNYSEYAVVLKHKVYNREYTQVALYGRTQTPRIDVINKFKAFALSQGFPREAILTPPPAGKKIAQHQDLDRYPGVPEMMHVLISCSTSVFVAPFFPIIYYNQYLP